MGLTPSSQKSQLGSPQKINVAAEKRAAILIQRLTSPYRGPSQATQESQSARRAEWSHSRLDERYPGLAE